MHSGKSYVNEGAVIELAWAALDALGFGRGVLPTAQLWAAALLKAQPAQPEEAWASRPCKVYRADGLRCYGVQAGQQPNASDFGLSLLEDRPIIRSHALPPYEVGGAHGLSIGLSGFLVSEPDDPSVWYFALDPNGNIEISWGGQLVPSRYGQCGKDAVYMAALGALKS